MQSTCLPTVNNHVPHWRSGIELILVHDGFRMGVEFSESAPFIG